MGDAKLGLPVQEAITLLEEIDAKWLHTEIEESTLLDLRNITLGETNAAPEPAEDHHYLQQRIRIVRRALKAHLKVADLYFDTVQRNLESAERYELLGEWSAVLLSIVSASAVAANGGVWAIISAGLTFVAASFGLLATYRRRGVASSEGKMRAASEKLGEFLTIGESLLLDSEQVWNLDTDISKLSDLLVELNQCFFQINQALRSARSVLRRRDLERLDQQIKAAAQG